MEYYAHIKKSDGVYLVSFPDVPGALTYGETLAEAKKHAAEALNGVLSVDFERGYTIPKPKERSGDRMYPILVYPHIALAFTLRNMRKKKTQQQLAKELGISYQAYQRLENPRTSNPTVKTLERIGEVLGKQVQVLFK